MCAGEIRAVELQVRLEEADELRRRVRTSPVRMLREEGRRNRVLVFN